MSKWGCAVLRYHVPDHQDAWRDHLQGHQARPVPDQPTKAKFFISEVSTPLFQSPDDQPQQEHLSSDLYQLERIHESYLQDDP